MLLVQIRRGNPAGRATEAALIAALGGELLRAPDGAVFALFEARPSGVPLRGGIEVAVAPPGFKAIEPAAVNDLIAV